MSYRFRILAVLLVLAISQARAQKINFRDEAELFKDSLPCEKRFAMLYFHYNGCPGCVVMDRTTLQDTAVAGFLNENFQSYSINTLTKRGGMLRDQFNGRTQPAFVFVDCQKKEIHRLCGTIEPAVFLEQLGFAVSPDKSLKSQKEQVPEKAQDFVFMEWHVRNLDLANTLDTAILRKAFAAFPAQVYGDSLFMHFFMDYAEFHSQGTLDFNSAPYQFFVRHPELLYKSFDSSRVAHVFCNIAVRHANRAEETKDEAEFRRAQKVVNEHWRDNVYYMTNKDGDIVGLSVSYYLPLQVERDYQFVFGSDTSYQRAEKAFYDQISNNFQGLYFSGMTSLDEIADKEVYLRKLKYINRAIELKKIPHVYVHKAVLEYLLGDRDAAAATLKSINRKRLKNDAITRGQIRKLEEKMK